MSVLYKFSVTICNARSPYSDIETLGDYILGFESYNENMGQRSTYNITNIPDYITSKMDSNDFGGPVFVPSRLLASGAVLKQYVPLSEAYEIPSQYLTSAYRIKYTNSNGYFALSDTLNQSLSEEITLHKPNSAEIIYSPLGGFSPTFTGSGADRVTTSSYTFPDFSDSLPTTGIFYVYSISVYPNENNKVYAYIDRITSLSSEGRKAVGWFNSLDKYFIPSDPYSGGGESDTGGGTGDFDGTSVNVDFTTLPTLSAVDTGFITLYNPTLTQLQSLANYMWSGLFDIDTFKKLFADPMQAILGLSIVPGPVPGGAAQNVKIGNIDSGVVMTKAATQYINIDCGTLNVEEFWGAYLDYEPYTKAEIYLPFIGVHQIAVDDIMNKSVHIMYHIDLLSGGCACEIKCGGSVLYTFIGSCAVSIPVTGSDWTNLINGVLSAASAIGTLVATGGATAPAAAGEIASAAVNSLKPSIEKSGSIAGAGGLLAGKVPVLILTRPRQALPGKQNTFTGYPAFITRSLGALSGYTEVHSIRLSGIDGTESEIDEIEELLKGGVIL